MKEATSTARSRVLRWQKDNPEKNLEKQRRYRKTHPERYKARELLASALRRGDLVRPDHCRCGKPKPEAHHSDYSKPLQVEWLCRDCHHTEHGGVLNTNPARNRKRNTLGQFAVVALVALVCAAPAMGDDYGTTPQEAKKMTVLIYKTFGTGWQGRVMLCIAKRESGLNPRAANYRDSNGGSYGLFQLNGVHRWKGESLAQFQKRQWNPHTHLIAAKRLARGGLGPWRGGAYSC